MNFAGSRGGGPIASAWAVMRYLGFAGYRDRVARLLAAKQRLMDGVGKIPGLQVFGRPDGPNCSFGSAQLDIAAVAQELNRRGWSFARQVDPPGILVLFNGFHGPVIEPFLTDLAMSVEGVESGRLTAAVAPAVYTG
jgi:glutamate/tyrosine decarboxylase-like PLP-dependent enzyme